MWGTYGTTCTYMRANRRRVCRRRRRRRRRSAESTARKKNLNLVYGVN